MAEGYEFIVALAIALGGAGGIMQIVKAVKAWRDGVKQREDDADARAITRLERTVERLEKAREADAVYIAVLMTALASGGLPVPPRPVA